MGALLKKHDLAVATVLVALWTAMQALTVWGTWSIDMSALYMAGYFAWTGEHDWIYGALPQIFTPLAPDHWTEVLAAYGLEDNRAVPFIYPPIWAFLVAPLAGTTEPIVFFDITRVFTTAAFGASILVSWKLMRPSGVSATVFSILSILIASITVPFLFSLSLNQPQFIVIFLTLLAFERYSAGKPQLAGVLLGVAAAVKVSPVLLCAIFLADRQWRAVAACVVAAGAIALVSLLVAGWDLHMTFLERVGRIEGLIPLIGFNMTFETMMHDFIVPFRFSPDASGLYLGIDTPWVSALSKILMLAAIWGALRVTRGVEKTAQLQVRLILVYLAVVWFGPLAWMHYYTLPLLLAPGLIGLWSIRQVALITSAMVIGFSEPLMVGFMERTLESGDYTTFFAQHIALAPLVAFAAALAIWAARQSARAPQQSGIVAAE